MPRTIRLRAAADAAEDFTTGEPRRASPLALLRAVFAGGPVHTAGWLLMVAIGVTIIVNALFRQHGAPPEPLVRPAALPAVTGETTGSLAAGPAKRPGDSPPAAPVNAVAAATRVHESVPATAAAPQQADRTKPAQPPPARRPQPAPASVPVSRIIAVQRALTEFGYGQIKPSGVLDEATKAALVRFERERKLPVSGQISERVLRALAGITGRPL